MWQNKCDWNSKKRVETGEIGTHFKKIKLKVSKWDKTPPYPHSSKNSKEKNYEGNNAKSIYNQIYNQIAGNKW